MLLVVPRIDDIDSTSLGTCIRGNVRHSSLPEKPSQCDTTTLERASSVLAASNGAAG